LKIRHAVAICLVPAVIGIALVTVSHIHGVTDYAKPHTVGELFALGQAQAGFVAASPSTLVVVIPFIGWVTLDSSRHSARRSVRVEISRGPPRISS
jgi:hypothetical protein